MSRNERLWLCLGLLALLAVEGLSVAMAGPRVHIPDELDDVEDNEEDEEWKEWGKAKESPVPFDPPPDPPEDPQELEKYQLEMMKRQTGPSMGFVKLRLGVQRSPVRIANPYLSFYLALVLLLCPPGLCISLIRLHDNSSTAFLSMVALHCSDLP